MDRTRSVKPFHLAVLALPALLIVSGCSGRRPVAEIAQAEQAVRHAQTTSEADRYAPVELTAAEQKLALARRAMKDRDYEDARRLAEQALADAQLAEAKAESEVARAQAVRTRQDIQALQVEASTPVVIESQKTITTTTTAPAVVVERPSTVVVERKVAPAPPPTQVIVERPAPPAIPTTIVVERPSSPSQVVVDREEAVVVVPER